MSLRVFTRTHCSRFRRGHDDPPGQEGPRLKLTHPRRRWRIQKTTGVCPVDDMGEILVEFAAEARESLVEVEAGLLELESDPTDLGPIQVIFRAIHTIKGTCGFFGLSELERLTHSGENLLSALRDGQCKFNEDMASTFLDLLDVLQLFIDQIERTQSDKGVDSGDLPERLQKLREDGIAAEAGTATVKAPAPEIEITDDMAELLREAQMLPSVNDGVSEEEPAEAKPVEAKPVEVKAAPTSKPPETKATPAKKTAPKAERARRSPEETSVRVATELLDRLVTLVGELVLARNQIVQRVGQHPDPVLTPASQRLDHIASELQEAVMNTRMQPLKHVFSRFPRLVRDVTRLCGKQAGLVVHGETTELDRTLIEAIRDPLTHILRNCIDHGIEAPEKRTAAGKTPQGTITVDAYHEGGFVNIDIIDDGGGIDVQRLKDKAVSNGQLTQAVSDQMSQREGLDLMFLAGLSTAGEVTNVSGRGVGMDVVRSKIEGIGGTVEVSTTLGKGSKFKLKIPLTLAIIPALIARCRDQRYAVPQANLEELIRYQTTKDADKIEVMAGCRFYRLRGRLLPLLWLESILFPDREPTERDVWHIVVLKAGEHTYGLVVDAVLDAQEIVVKPLGGLLESLNIFAGTMITADGRASLILDPTGIAARGNLSRRSVGVRLLDAEVEEETTDSCALLIFASHTDGRMAVPLDQITRLEELPKDQVEVVGGCSVIQYRDEILPLANVSELLPERRVAPRPLDASIDPAQRDTLHVLVHSHGGRQIGLIVGRILDTVPGSATKQRGRAGREGVLFTFVQNDRITEYLDLQRLVQTASPGFYDAAA